MSFSLDLHSQRETERFFENLCSEINTSYMTVGQRDVWDLGSKRMSKVSKMSKGSA